MHRTSGDNNVAGMFTDGPPGTTIEERWLNSMQEEIAAVVEDAGLQLKNPEDDTNDQLLLAIPIIAARSSTSVLVCTNNHTITSAEIFQTYLCNTTGGSITIVCPDLAANENRKFKVLHAIQGGSNTVTVNRAGADVITGDSLTSIVLPKRDDYIDLIGGAAAWYITDEKISAQLRLSAMAGNGSVETYIMRMTNVVENIANSSIFTENHTTGYDGNKEGLKFTIVKGGVYSFDLVTDEYNNYIGFSLNSAQLTTSVRSITLADLLTESYDSNYVDACSITIRLKKNDVVRLHDSANAASARGKVSITYHGA